MEALIAPVTVLCIAFGINHVRFKAVNTRITSIEMKQAELVQELVQQESETPKKIMATLMPLSTAVRRINQEIGLEK